VGYQKAVRNFARSFLLAALQDHNGIQCSAAKELGMHRNSLGRNLVALGISRAEVLKLRKRREGLTNS
jgi:DNA-binding NtrC family response regulator